jgi:hypothetical protein
MARIVHSVHTRVVVLLAAVAAVFVLVGTSPALAAPAITQPTANPYHVVLDAQGRPVPFTVVASGFPFRTAVFVEQCNGRSPNAPNWSPTVDCDIASAQAPVYADSHGVARFVASRSQVVLRAFSGPSPQGLFNCIPPRAKSSNNGLPDFRACQIRVSSSPTQITADQVFLPIVLGASGSTSSNSSNPALWITLGVLAVFVVAVAVVLISRRRTPSRPSTRR